MKSVSAVDNRAYCRVGLVAIEIYFFMRLIRYLIFREIIMKNVFKKSLSILIAVAIVFGSAYVGFSEFDFNGSFAVKGVAANGMCGDNITWTFDDEGILAICGMGSMTSYLYSSDVPWYDMCSSVIKVVIDIGITSIGDCAFSDCTSLTSVTLPDSVTSIGDCAFSNCTSLTSVTLPDSVTSIGDNTFSGCTSLTSVTLPDGVTSIGDSTFSGCTSLTSATIPDSVTSIGNGVFDFCTNLYYVKLPEKVEECGNSLFAQCWNLMSVSIPDGVEMLFVNDSDAAMPGCCSLECIIIPDSVHFIIRDAFSDSFFLEDIFFSGSSDKWEALMYDGAVSDNVKVHCNDYAHNCSGNLYWGMEKQFTCTENGVVLLKCSACGEVFETVEIEAECNIKVIDESTYDVYEGVSIIQPTCTTNGTALSVCNICEKESIREIPTGSKYHKYSDEWTVEEEPTCSATGVKSRVCSVCGDIERVSISELAHTYGEWVVDIVPTCSDSGTKHITCSDCGHTLTAIVEKIAHNYSTEWTVDIAPTCTEVGSKSHHCVDCSNETAVSDVTTIEALGHSFVTTSVDEEHPHTITYKCSRCPEIKEEDSYSEKCGVCNFSYTDKGDGTYNITGYIGNSNSFVIPAFIDGKKVTTVDASAFRTTTKLISVEIEYGIQSIGAYAFMRCSRLSKIVIPESVTSIGAKAFYSCASGFTIYCYRDSYAMQYAIDNSFNYVIMDIGETANSTIDYENNLVFISKICVTNIEDIIYTPLTSTVSTKGSFVSGDKSYYGTGSKFVVVDNDTTTEYTLVVEGDTNGDSVCDVLDVWQVEKVSNGHEDLTDEHALAADCNKDDCIDIYDYQEIVNMVVS